MTEAEIAWVTLGSTFGYLLVGYLTWLSIHSFSVRSLFKKYLKETEHVSSFYNEKMSCESYHPGKIHARWALLKAKAEALDSITTVMAGLFWPVAWSVAVLIVIFYLPVKCLTPLWKSRPSFLRGIEHRVKELEATEETKRLAEKEKLPWI